MKILVVDDDPVNRLILEKFLLKWGHPVVCASDGAEAWNLLQQPDAPRLVILDWMMPHMDGAQLCKAIRDQRRGLYTYVIMLTAKGQKEDIVAGLEAGADDYMTKPFDPNELRSRLRAGLRILELEEQLIHARDLLEIKASRDGLTGLWNRAAILDILEKELSRARRSHNPLAVIMADLDHFKRINDTYGHLAGDAVLRETAQRLCRSARSYDAVGRYGGEEFLIIAPGQDLPAALTLAERLRRVFEEAPVTCSEGPISVTLSLGVAATADGYASESLLRAADAALYRAKQLGRNRVESVPAASAGAAKPSHLAV